MAKGKLADALNFMGRLTSGRMINALKIAGSYYHSRATRKAVISGMPVSLSIEPTTHCNLRCPQCPSGLRSFSRPTGMIDPALFQNIVDQLKETLCYLTFYFQGEPYLHPDFLRMVSYAEASGIYTATSTNAHYLDPVTAEETIKSGLSRLIISMDGLDQSSYSKYRIGGRLEKVKEGIRNLAAAKRKWKSSRPYIILQLLAMKHNVDQIPAFRDFAKQTGVNEARVKTAQVYDFEGGASLVPDERRYSRYRKDREGTLYLDNKLYDHCWRMWRSCVITWDGRIAPCCFDKDASYELGNAGEMPFPEIWQGKAYRDFRTKLFRSRKSIDICRNCTEGTKVWI